MHSQLFSSVGGRFLKPLCALAVIRLVFALVLYVSFEHHLVPLYPPPDETRQFAWLYLFANWDSAHYVEIARWWYPSQFAPQWAFFPLYPVTIRALALFGVDWWMGAFLVATICGLLSAPLFQAIAEQYMDRSMAMTSTMTYFLLPYLFVFTTVSYSEPLYLFLTLLAWYFHSRSRDALSGVATALASLVRSYGIFILLPISLDFVRRREYRRLAYAVPAVIVIAAWLTYGSTVTGKFLAPLSAESYWQNETTLSLQTILSKLFMGNLDVISNLSPYFKVIFGGVVFLCFILILSVKAYKYDRALGVYSAISTILITSFGAFPAYLSVPRFLSFLFPIGLPLHTTRRIILTVVLGLLLILDYLAWYAFLTDIFFFR